MLSSVEAGRTGSASGLNSAVARTGGLIATALIDALLAAKGSAVVSAFHIAALCAGGASVSGALAAFLMIGRLSSQVRAR